MDSINNLRAQINEIDRQLMFLLNHRFDLCKQIGEEKKKLNCAVYDPEREQTIISNLSQDEDYEGMVAAIWPTIMEFSRGLQ